jgi:hypothetical protein
MVTERVSPDGNVTVSTLMFIPSVLDAGNLLVCRAGNPGIPDSMMEDAWKLEIHCKFIFSFVSFPVFQFSIIEPTSYDIVQIVDQRPVGILINVISIQTMDPLNLCDNY